MRVRAPLLDQTICVQILASPSAPYVTLGKSLKFSALQFFHL